MKRNEEPTDFINKVEKKIIYNKIKFLKFRFKKNFKIMKKHKINIEHVSKLSQKIINDLMILQKKSEKILKIHKNIQQLMRKN